jgi:FeS assembly SUF system protein
MSGGTETRNRAEAAPAEAAPAGAGAPTEAAVVEALKTVYDPEIPVDIYELGLIYDIGIEPEGKVAIKMTLTAPGCPVAGTMPQMVEDAIRAKVAGVNEVEVELVWDPPWDFTRMSEAARLELNMF